MQAGPVRRRRGKRGMNRYPKFRHDADGKPICRGCGTLVPKGRRAWCSTPCYETNCPQAAIQIAKRRDHGICRQCGYDYPKSREEWRKDKPTTDYSGHMAWLNRRPKPVEYHHVIPFSEGGSHGAENLLTLCHGCHARETANWLAAKAISRREKKQPLLMGLGCQPIEGAI